MKSKKNIKYGNVEIAGDEFESKNCKIRVTAFIDLDIVEALKDEADQTKSKYQTLLNKRLRESIFGSAMGSDLDQKIRAIVREELGKKAG